MKPEQYKQALNFDPLADAERVTGKSYKKDETTMHLGFLMHLQHTARKHAMLAEADDTSSRTPLEDYLRIAKEIGFETVLEHDIVIPENLKKDYDNNRVDRHYIMWHPQYSILLNFDSYTSYGGNCTVNGGNFYYAWRPHDKDSYGSFISTGSFSKFAREVGDYIWVGSHDCREALRFKIAQLLEGGEFLTQWPEYGHPWLMHYGDQRIGDAQKETTPLYGSNGYWSQVNHDYASKLPEHVQKAICFTAEAEG
jgi:hypothetical protein